ncbi:hypothetical protein DFH07DRAFT_1055915 [Mycena maculata]|uniref:TauD/TfdA-like domain-containing protein n=1 Tax=Mycena maculata TaxID=230809 RepID=A0AAD7NYM6_9AGAR|nr:hypothetical protein DFH07DRAFT_1055915 [Mycena maculata]
MFAILTATATATEPISSLMLNGTAKKEPENAEEPYRYAHLMPVYSKDKYPPLQPFEHIDAESRAPNHANPRSFLDSANIVELTLGRTCGKDELALEVARRGVVVFRDQQDFIDRGADFYTKWGRHFGPLHIHPTSGHPEGHPEIHLVYKDANSRFNTDGLTTTVWHSALLTAGANFSFELQPPGLTTFFLLSQPKSGGDTLYSSQVKNLRMLLPVVRDFLRTLKATHSGFDSLRSTKGGVLRRDPIETAHPVTGEEALYVNKQFTRRIVGKKKEESDLLLTFLYDHIAKSGDHQARIKWEPMSMVLWVRPSSISVLEIYYIICRITALCTAHSAISDYSHLKARRHGARDHPAGRATDSGSRRLEDG